MKTYQIEIQRLKSITHDHGRLDLRVDALVLPSQKSRGGEDDDAQSSTVLSLSEKDARSLLILLKAQLADLEPRKGRSQR